MSELSQFEIDNVLNCLESLKHIKIIADELYEIKKLLMDIDEKLTGAYSIEEEAIDG